MKPVIGLTTYTSENRQQINNAYLKSVEQAGGIPVGIPILKEEDVEAVLDRIDGLILIGGNDVDPMLFNEDPHQKIGTFAKELDYSDIRLFKAALKRNMPILGVCRGLQIINVALGGSLIQDIPAQVEGAIAHKQASKRGETTHFVELLGGKIQEILGEERVHVNSFHHQAAGRVGEGLTVTATSSDGIIEALEYDAHPYCVSVQWHPEELSIVGDDYAKKLFASLVEASKKTVAI